MANATTADARAGYEIFLSLGTDATRSEINDRLTRAGYAPVSERTFRHYRHLAAAGFNRYVPINRFDVARASEPYENLSAHGRYDYLTSGAGVRVTFPRGRALVDAFGVADLIGEVGALITFEDPATVAALQRQHPRLGEILRIDFLDPPRQLDCRVLEVDYLRSTARFEIEFTRLQPIAEYVGSVPLPVGRFRIRISPDDSPSTIDVVGRQIYDIFELVEGARSVVNEALHVSHVDRHASISRVQQLRMSSPIFAIVEVPYVVGTICATAVTLLSTAIMYERWRRTRLENNDREVDLGVKRAKAELEQKKITLEEKILAEMEERLGVSLAQNQSVIRKAVHREVLQMIEGMAERQVQGIQVKELLPPNPGQPGAKG